MNGIRGELISVPNQWDFPLCVSVLAEVWESELGAFVWEGRVWIFGNGMVYRFQIINLFQDV